MQLDQPIPPPYSGGDNQFDFILNENQKPKKSLLPKARSPKQRILYVLGGGLALFTLLMIILAIVLSGNGGSTQSLVTIAQTQTEILRVSAGGGAASRSITTQNFAANIVAAMTTSQQQTIQYLSSHGKKLDAKQLVGGKNTKTDAALKSANDAGRYDEELNSILKQSLTDYQAQLKEAAKNSTSDQKQLLDKLSSQTTILLKNQPATSS